MAGADQEAGFRGGERWNGLKPTNDETDDAGWLVRCVGCGIRRPAPTPDYCQRCGSPLEVELDYGEDLHPERLFDGCITDLWKYGNLYPVSLRHAVKLSLGKEAPR